MSAIDMNDEQFVRRDRMRFINNSQSASLCYLGILLDVFFFVSIYKSDVGTYYYNILIGASIVYNLCFMLAVFLASEGVKVYQRSSSYLLLVVGVLQIVRVFIIPMRAHSATTVINGEEALVMHDGQFFRVVAYLVISAVCLIAAALINLKKASELEAHMKTLGVQNA